MKVQELRSLLSARWKYFPMPDYDFGTANQVSVMVYGKTIDELYTWKQKVKSIMGGRNKKA